MASGWPDLAAESLKSTLEDWLGPHLTGMSRFAQTRPLLLYRRSPAPRPIQVTHDLAGFWKRGDPGIRRELRVRYPKHAWPEDPTRATPIAGARRAHPPARRMPERAGFPSGAGALDLAERKTWG